MNGNEMGGVAAALSPKNVPHVPLGDTSRFSGVTSALHPVTRGTCVARENREVTPSGTCGTFSADSTERGDRLLYETRRFITQYVDFPSEDFATAVTLWIAHTWFADTLYTTPRLIFSSPEKRSGKTRAQEVTALLCPNPVNTINVSPAYLFRKLQPDEGDMLPTIFLDETDALFTGKASENTEAIRGIINAGYKRGATVGRAEIRNKTVEVCDYPVFAPVCLAGIGGLPDTIEDRAVIVPMKRRRPDTRLKPFRDRSATAEAAPLRERLERWGRVQASIVETWRDADYPRLPDAIQDRDADVWEPLFIVAGLAGGPWPGIAAAIAPKIIAGQHVEPTSAGERLLYDIRTVFDATGEQSLPTVTLIGRLKELEDSPWETMGDSGIGVRDLGRMLKPYDIGIRHGHQHSIRWHGSPVRGYRREDFEDAWARYLQPAPAARTA
ncbi:phiRv2 prophage protein [Bifidobacterium dentium]|uniref:PhiRv2 prophage protein n=1 Tax=Bifidobacterium dentium (strain ATCC 27534 / DSM 20436 / JCM 1195 / Bd1) TaxID=401473 RepID=D2Q8Z6_BIFDB|nr:phiRv2 prophage protein [Bifidobacterium dentium Bd1]SEB72945.1 Protein of unknown function [Bifidobacterium dentium JCM 1195 = DSM 20436]VEG23252.1 phiRv2 prophage protein [Bifidobacterium dentium]